jgi:CRP-like cAMP-binding protein
LIKQSGNRTVVRKGTSIIREGEDVNFIFYVESGCFRAFRWSDDKEITIGFSFAGDIDTCPHSLIHSLPSSDTIEALSDSTIIIIYRKEVDALIHKNTSLHRFIQKLLVNYIEILLQRIIEIKTESAEDRYRKLLLRQPQEVANIPLKYIASYLGISQERLSRIRKKMVIID